MTDSIEAAVRRLEIGLQACNSRKKKNPTQVFSCEYCKVFQSTFFYRKPPMANSDSNNKVLTKKLKFAQHLFLNANETK